jgi:NAD(P)H-hydrate repair Nnr-like enzyme with NAD(P)H-hydrate dehydratase domain
MLDYWLKQTTDKPLFPDIEWQRPEQKALRGKLLIIGGNKLGFAAVAQAYNDALAAGAGECRVILPDALKPVIDKQAFDCLFVPSNPSGGMSKDALQTLQAASAWADTLLLIGDAGRNSETAITLEALLTKSDKLALITRDAVDLLRANTPQLLQRDKTVLIITLAQLQKIFQAVYYPKTILFSMSLMALVEALHKFTITYPVTLVVFHQNQLVVASNGRVSTTPWEQPLMIWRGSVAAKAAVYAMQQQKALFEALTASLATA